MTAILEKELDTYRRELPTLKSQTGKFALVSGDKVLGVWGTYEDAIQEGYRECGPTEPFLVKKIEAYETTHFNSRMIEAACPP